VLSHTVSTTYNFCVPKWNSHLLTCPMQVHVWTRTGAVMVTWLSVWLCWQLWVRRRSPKATWAWNHLHGVELGVMENV
jgi:hypothetical protein